MSTNYTQFDWAIDRQARMSWADEEERLDRSIDRWMNKRNKRNGRRRAKRYE